MLQFDKNQVIWILRNDKKNIKLLTAGKLLRPGWKVIRNLYSHSWSAHCLSASDFRNDQKRHTSHRKSIIEDRDERLLKTRILIHELSIV